MVAEDARAAATAAAAAAAAATSAAAAAAASAAAAGDKLAAVDANLASPETDEYETLVMHAQQLLGRQPHRRPMGRHASATHIQANFRRHTVRRTLTALNHATSLIQAAERGHVTRQRLAASRPPALSLTDDQRQEMAGRWEGILPSAPSPPPRTPMAPQLSAVFAAMPVTDETKARQPVSLKKKRTKQRLGANRSASPAPSRC